MAKRGTSSNPFQTSSFEEEDDYETEEWEEEEEEVEEKPTRTQARRAPRINPQQFSQRANTPSGLPAPPPSKQRKPVLSTPPVTPSRVRAETRPAPEPVRRTRQSAPPTQAPRGNPAPQRAATAPKPAAQKPAATPKPAAPKPAAPKEVAQRGRPRGKVQAATNPLTSSSYSNGSRTTVSAYPSTPTAAPYGYSSLYSSPTSSIGATNTEQPKNKIIPNIRAAGQRRMERGEARSIDQGTALEIVSKLVGRSISIVDIENDKKAAGMAIFAQPTELVTLFELAVRMVESHQFYSKTV
jgi:hypothetical protein